jgi:molybdopterin molybdotransferase
MPAPLLPFDEVFSVVTECAGRLSARIPALERVDLAQSAGRILAQPLRADSDQPPFARSTRDGFACRASEASAHQPLAVAGTIRAGDSPSSPLAPGSAYEIMTGAPVPDGADAVAMLEHVETLDNRVRLLPPRMLEPGENVVARGAQAHAHDELLPTGTPIGAAQIALAATCGLSSLDVFVRPRVAILTTGDELVPVDAVPGPGQIRNSNAPMLAALVAAAGGEPITLSTAADNDDALAGALARAAGADMLLISGGVSAGKFDLVEPALERLGARFHFTGVRIQPGKPLVFGELPGGEISGLPFFGLPGNPISSAVTFTLFAAPVLAALAGSRIAVPRFALAQLAEDATRGFKPGLTRFVPALCEFASTSGRLPHVARVTMHDSGDIAAFSRSNCFLVIPEHESDLKEGAIVRILLS